MPSPRRCSHPVRQIMEFNPLGAVVGCVLCDATFDMDEELMQEWVDFTHTSPNGKAHDLHILVNPKQVTETI